MTFKPDLFTTYKVQLRQADEWLTLLEGGRMTSLDKSEVRALASRYGDPYILLSEEWIPYVPGINAPGSYEDYAADPCKVAKEVMDKAKDGSYEYLLQSGREAVSELLGGWNR